MNEAIEFTRSGDYVNALERFKQYHQLSRSDDSQFGSRVTFAFSRWAKLGKEYPPALDAIREVRNKNAEAIETGSTDETLFLEVARINEVLLDYQSTAELFRHIAEFRPDFSKRCFRHAEEALVREREWGILSCYRGSMIEFLLMEIGREEAIIQSLASTIAKLPQPSLVKEEELIDSVRKKALQRVCDWASLIREYARAKGNLELMDQIEAALRTFRAKYALPAEGT